MEKPLYNYIYGASLNITKCLERIGPWENWTMVYHPHRKKDEFGLYSQDSIKGDDPFEVLAIFLKRHNANIRDREHDPFGLMVRNYWEFEVWWKLSNNGKEYCLNLYDETYRSDTLAGVISLISPRYR